MVRRTAHCLGWVLAVATFVGTTVAAGCTATEEGTGEGKGNSGTGATGAGGGTGNSSASGGTDFDAGWSDGTLGDGDTCHAETQEATLSPLHMILLVDRSSSMLDAGYWGPTLNAITAFVTDPLSDGLYVGLSWFPAKGSPFGCNPALWNPVHVPPGAPPLALLPADVGTLTGALSSTIPYGNTPMYGALQGTYDFIRQSMMPAHPGQKHIAVLISDGEPCCENCPFEDIHDICTQAVAPAFDNDGIETYTLAIDPVVLDEMDVIAACGGTGSAYDVTGSAIGDFAQHLQDIRGRALGCEYQIPDLAGAEVEFDPLKVNVYITFSGATEPTLIPQKGSAADCGTDDGWYYDDPLNPTKIILCPATCAKIEADQEAKIDIAFGCPTVVE